MLDLYNYHQVQVLTPDEVTLNDVIEQFPPPERLTDRDFQDEVETEAYLARLYVHSDLPNGLERAVMIIHGRSSRAALIVECNQEAWTLWRRGLPKVLRDYVPRIRPTDY